MLFSEMVGFLKPSWMQVAHRGDEFDKIGVTHQTLFSIYDSINVRQESPWNEGLARLQIITDTVWTVGSWVEANARSAVSRTERERFPVDKILSSLERMGNVATTPSSKKLRERIMSVREEIKRQF